MRQQQRRCQTSRQSLAPLLAGDGTGQSPSALPQAAARGRGRTLPKNPRAHQAQIRGVSDSQQTVVSLVVKEPRSFEVL